MAAVITPLSVSVQTDLLVKFELIDRNLTLLRKITSISCGNVFNVPPHRGSLSRIAGVCL